MTTPGRGSRQPATTGSAVAGHDTATARRGWLLSGMREHVDRRTDASHPSPALGAAVGGLVAVGFAVVHDVMISDIWFNVGPMLVAGAGCGLCIVWSYRTTTIAHAWGRWVAYNASLTVLLVGLGGVSLVVLDPRLTMAALMVASDPLGEVIPPAVPLMAAATMVGALVVWLLFSRRRHAAVPILVTQLVLVLLVGHNLAILGLVELTSDALPLVWKFIGLTVLLAAAFAGGVVILAVLGRRLSPSGVNRRRGR